MDLGRSSKEDVIRYALDKNNIRNLSEVVMIGDRKFDIIGAKTVGISSIGVLYGFGSYDEIKDSGADYIAADIHELYEIITNHN
jgi:phosphoglycolate phosphatase